MVFSSSYLYFLSQLKLANDPQVKAVSSFHELNLRSSLKTLNGGIYLGERQLKELKDYLFVYDKSVDFFHMTQRVGIKDYVEIETRGMDPFEVSLFLNETKLTSSLLVNCKKEQEFFISQLKVREKKLIDYKEKIERKIKESIFFFVLGESFANSSFVMVRDGFVLWLIKKFNLSTYPTDLPYASVSQKIYTQLEKEKKRKVFVFLENSDDKLDLSAEKKANDLFVRVKGSVYLIPGIPQIEFLEVFLPFLMEHL